ncbi:tRNA-dihydrouridine synthase family protein [Patescibacteria group bacterium]|nr:tRNA-dihydrouridine synthase family protein [Patescibacteria group bacterium]MBU1160691.1 tRNA-dihydrouridine synthase family protein [Patescibacteria group bacterium]MBU1684324.1 tRNA-dihydrouridine synthase family protein [Patescibacteria group bacterium]MBU1778235.1 tRNA-dihydrouridine synthase family protein [Patescibacteria group bacterium]MBU1987349.1 tRNA-dihydrouridine synthase family protein [Patescibacteria group bacterium]
MKKDQSFWQKLKKPIYALAPMAGITDSAFRQICKEFGSHITYSEMASVAALVHSPKKTLEMLYSTKKESPYIVQLFGNDPKYFVKAIKLLTDKKQIANLGISNYCLPDGIDINLGCPVPKIVKQGAGSVLMQNLKLAREIIKNVINSTNLPISIKLRSKSGKISALTFLDNTRDLDIKAVMIHGRTKTQGFAGRVNYNIIKKSRNYFSGIILANGGVINKETGDKLLQKTNADGLGIARGALGRPWIFQELISQSPKSINISKIIIKHAKLLEKLKGKHGIIEMRKHLCWYVRGLPCARKLRAQLVRVKTIEDINAILELA